MNLPVLMSDLQTKYHGLPPHQKKRVQVVAILMSLLLITLLYQGARLLLTRTPPPIPNLLLRQGKTIVIPKDSPLRTQLMLQTITASKQPHKARFPSLVEADPAKTVAIYPQLTGRLTHLNVTLGDDVKQDQILAVMASPPLAEAYANCDKAKSILIEDRETLKRTQNTFKAGASAIKDVALAKSHYEQALAEWKRANDTVRILGNNTFSLLNVRAPIAGKITAITYGIGSYINDTTSPLFTLTNTDSVFITANIPENAVRLITPGIPAEITLSAYPNDVFYGKVASVSPLLDPDTRRNKTRIVFQNPKGKLQPNMFATVTLSLVEKEHTLVPLSAILMNNDTPSVFVEKKPWIFVRRDVALGVEDGQKVRVLAGLKTGDRVVTSGGILINDQ